MHSNARIIVCGASGFLGSHILGKLNRYPDTIAFPLHRTGQQSVETTTSKHTANMFADITDALAVRDIFSRIRPTHVVNAASYGGNPLEQDFSTCVAVNLLGVHNLLSAASEVGVRRFVQIGSYFEYGAHSFSVDEECTLKPYSQYAATKAAGSLLIKDNRLRGNVEAVVARAFHLWGPREHPHRLTPQVITASRTREPLKLTAGAQIKDFTFVEDAARWICDLTLRSGALEYGVYNIAGGRRCSVRDFVVDLASRVNGSDSFEFGAYEIPRREPPNGTADTSRLVSAIGPLEPTPFDAAASSTIAALQS